MLATVRNDRIVLNFPFDWDILRVVQGEVPDRAWNLKGYEKVWSVPMSPFHCAEVIRVLQPLGFVIDPEIQRCADPKAARPRIRKQLPAGLYPYQKEGIEFIYAARGRALIADDMGLGKTAQALVFADLWGGEKILIVAPANVIWKWATKERDMWASSRSVQVIETGTQPIEDKSITVMSYAIMVKKYQELSRIPFDTMIFDEAHYLKNGGAQRSRAAKKLVRGVPHLLLLTGTPFTNGRMELFPLLHMLDPQVWPNAINFGERYAGGEFGHGHWIKPPTGHTNTEELQERLAPVMLRRTKKQVAIDLPDLTRVSLPVTIDGKKYQQVLKDVRKEAKGKPYQEAHALTLLNKLRQVVGREKVGDAVELAESILEAGEKVVLFAHHKEVVSALSDALRHYGVRVIDGSTKPKDRQDISDAFMNRPYPRVIVASLAGREGIDLYASSHLIVVERQWTPDAEEQMEARLHRNGQKNFVTAHYLVARGTVDQKLDDLVRSKREGIRTLVASDIIREVYQEVIGE